MGYFIYRLVKFIVDIAVALNVFLVTMIFLSYGFYIQVCMESQDMIQL